MFISILLLYSYIQGVNGLKATQMITELIRDNRKIVDRIQPHDIDAMVRLVKDKRVRNNYLSKFSLKGTLSRNQWSAIHVCSVFLKHGFG